MELILGNSMFLNILLSYSNLNVQIGIIGFGRFGQFLAKTFRHYCDIFATSRGDYTVIARNLGVVFLKTAEEMLKMKMDVVVLCTRYILIY